MSKHPRLVLQVVEDSVDGFYAASWLEFRGTAASNVAVACWGSPHVELSNGQCSAEKQGAASSEKPRVFNSLCEQFPEALVLVTYARHWVDEGSLRSDHHVVWDVSVGVEAKGEVQYIPRYSTGWRRCDPNEVRAIIGIPKGVVIQLYSQVDLWDLISTRFRGKGGTCLFLGEEGADLSRCAAQHHCEALEKDV